MLGEFVNRKHFRKLAGPAALMTGVLLSWGIAYFPAAAQQAPPVSPEAIGKQTSTAPRPKTLAATPPMGWNSWDTYGLSITEDEFSATTELLHTQLQQYGWQFAVIDEGWYLSNPSSNGKPAWQYTMDANGRYMPAENRFPSAAEGVGLKKIADKIHSRDLRLGIHIIRGIPREAVDKNLPIADSSFHAADAADTNDTCRWNPDNYGVKDNAAGQAYYDSLAKLYAGWGIDFIKVDCISFPYKTAEIRMLSEAIKKTGRPIILSLSPGPTPIDEAADVAAHAQMWRISDDVWDHWDKWPDAAWSQSVKGQFDTLAEWVPSSGPGHWPDADMLPIGYLGPRPGYREARQSGLNPDEQQTLVTLWAISRSPLMMGGDLHHLDARVLNLLTNPEVISVDQDSNNSHPLLRTADSVVWTATPATGGGIFIALFNLADSTRELHYTWSQLNVTLQKKDRLRDLWQLKSTKIKKKQDGITLTLAPHASALYRIGGKGFEQRSLLHYFF